ncbi:hypothetical protein ACO0QE_004204 [Hanseniaspora vineae]
MAEELSFTELSDSQSNIEEVQADISSVESEDFEELQVVSKKQKHSSNTPINVNTRQPPQVSDSDELVVIAEDIRNEQVSEVIDDDDIEIIEKPSVPRDKSKEKGEVAKSITQYQCPICLEPPSPAMITKCGHVFCTDCLFNMLNSSRTHRLAGTCALCRTKIPLNKTNLMVMKYNTVKKPN